MPQAPNTPNAPAQPQSEADRQIQRAKQLEHENGELQKKIADNRTYLRLMQRNGALDKQQEAWLRVFYPLKTKGSSRSDDDVKATREAKKAARAAATNNANS